MIPPKPWCAIIIESYEPNVACFYVPFSFLYMKLHENESYTVLHRVHHQKGF